MRANLIDTALNLKCPACNTTHSIVGLPTYQCFCGAKDDPEFSNLNVPHSCSGPCQRVRPCGHICPALCHPGPCPPCNVTVTNTCGCDRTSRTQRCGDGPFSCGEICGKKPTDCHQNHVCELICHVGECPRCDIVSDVKCGCGKQTQQMPCHQGQFVCEEECMRLHNCGVHVCTKKCHLGECGPCDLEPSNVISCWCGKATLSSLNSFRTRCTDPIPSCLRTCGKKMPCGHNCSKECHMGKCVCESSSEMVCRCGATSKKALCSELKNFVCDTPCGVKKSCGKHKCLRVCCPLRPFGESAIEQPEGMAHMCTEICE